MQERRLITHLGTDNIDTLIQGMPLLLVACIRDINEHGIPEKLKTTAVHVGPHVEVCYAREDLLPYFEKRYHVCGTPTFLLIRQGVIADVLLGNQTAQDIVAWVEPLVQDPKRTMMSLKKRVSLQEVSSSAWKPEDHAAMFRGLSEPGGVNPLLPVRNIRTVQSRSGISMKYEKR
jgi:hypothetical protein